MLSKVGEQAPRCRFNEIEDSFETVGLSVVRVWHLADRKLREEVEKQPGLSCVPGGTLLPDSPQIGTIHREDQVCPREVAPADLRCAQVANLIPTSTRVQSGARVRRFSHMPGPGASRSHVNPFFESLGPHESLEHAMCGR